MRKIAICAAFSFLLGFVSVFFFHIAPGIFMVFRGPAVRLSSDILLLRCNRTSVNEQAKLECLKNAIHFLYPYFGAGVSMELLVHLYKNDASFARNCHDFTHIVGRDAYLFSGHVFTRDTDTLSLCGHGFYHGFMETLIAKNRNTLDISAICEDDERTEKLSRQEKACYHGIGHGYVTTHDLKRAQQIHGNIARGLALCEKFDSEEKILFCATGVYNGVSISIKSNGIIDREQPGGYCFFEDNRYKDICYADAAMLVVSMYPKDFERQLYVASYTGEKAYENTFIRYVANNHVKESLDSLMFAPDISHCFNVPKHLISHCIEGYIDGIFEFGTPGAQYIDALSICRSGKIETEFASVCFRKVKQNMIYWYGRDASASICNTSGFIDCPVK